MSLASTLEQLSTFLKGGGIRHALIGGLAMHAHGLSRFTSYIDLVAEFAAQEEIVTFLESRKFSTVHRSAGYSNHLGADGVGVDFIYVDSKTMDRILESSSPGDEAPIVGAQHLIAMKLLALKNDPTRMVGELRDIEFLLRRPGVDFVELREYFAKHDRLELFDELERRLAR